MYLKRSQLMQITPQPAVKYDTILQKNSVIQDFETFLCGVFEVW